MRIALCHSQMKRFDIDKITIIWTLATSIACETIISNFQQDLMSFLLNPRKISEFGIKFDKETTPSKIDDIFDKNNEKLMTYLTK